MVVTIFRSRLNPDVEVEYDACLRRLTELVESMPGYITHKTFLADDGERVTVVEFESMATQLAWANHPSHLAAQELGRQRLYSEFSIQVCRLEYQVNKELAEG